MTSSSVLNFRHQENQDSETLKMFVLTFVGVWEVQSPQHGITLHIKPSTGSAPPALSIWTARHLVFLFHIWWGCFHREEVFGILELVVPGRVSGGRLQGEGKPVNTELTHFAVRQKRTQCCEAVILKKQKNKPRGQHFPSVPYYLFIDTNHLINKTSQGSGNKHLLSTQMAGRSGQVGANVGLWTTWYTWDLLQAKEYAIMNKTLANTYLYEKGYHNIL